MSYTTTRKSLICGRADKVLGATAAALAAATGSGLIGTQATVEADVVYHIGVNINIPVTFDGVYLNVVTGVHNPVAGSVPGWDINPWSATTLSFHSLNSGTSGGYVQRTGGGGVASLTYGTLIGPGSTFANGSAFTNGAQPWILNSDNIIGFRFFNEDTSAVHYGWALINVGASLTAPRTLVSYAYESDPGVAIIGVPEPTTLGLLSMGAIGLLATRRRRVA